MSQFGQSFVPATGKRSSFYIHCAGCGQRGLFAIVDGAQAAGWLATSDAPTSHNGSPEFTGLCLTCIDRGNWPKGGK